MLGKHAGDSLLAPYEWSWTPEEIMADITARGGLVPHEYEPFDFVDTWDKTGKTMISAGQPTDDSELAAALAESLVSKGELDPRDLYYRLRGFIHDRKSILTDIAYGIGGTLRDALSSDTYEMSLERFARGEVRTPPSNGSLMRCIPIPLAFYTESFLALVDAARIQSLVTHRNPACVAACIAYSIYVRNILDGHAPAGAAIRMLRALTEKEVVPSSAIDEVLALDFSQPPSWEEIEPQKGSVMLSLRIAIWAAIQAKDFADGIMKVGLLGGDTDTYGAIAGGILGARFGVQGIPEKWASVMRGREKMLELADGLYELAHK